MKNILARTLALAVISIAMASVSYAQSNKPIIGVGTFESSFSDYDSRNIQTAIETALSKTGKFTLIERGRLDQLLAEQNLSIQGLVDSGASEFGGFGGVDYLLYGRVTQLGLESKNLLIMSACEAKFGLDVRVVDVATAEIRLSENITDDDQVNTSDSESNPCRGIEISAFDNLAAKVSRKIAEKLTQTLFPVKIARVTGDQVYLNYGAGFLKNGELLKIVTLGEGFIDPDTGEVLGADEELIGVVEVTETKAKFSIGKIRLQTSGLSVGDVANRLGKSEIKSLDRKLKSCNRAMSSEQKACKKEGSRCDKAIAKREDACAL